MILLWILGILAFLLLLLCRTRVRVLASMRESRLSLDLNIGLIRMRLYPPPERKPEDPSKKKKRKKKKKPAEEAEPSRRLPVPTLEDVRDALRALPGPLFRGLLRVGKGLRIHPLNLSIVFGGWEDPPAAAENYGTASAIVWTFMPLLERRLNIPDPDIRLDTDFTAPETLIEGEIGVSARTGTLLAVGAGIGIPALRWLRRTAKRHRDSDKAGQDKNEGKAGNVKDVGKAGNVKDVGKAGKDKAKTGKDSREAETGKDSGGTKKEIRPQEENGSAA